MAGYVVTLLTVVTVVFAVPRAIPGDPLAHYMVVDYDTGYEPNPEEIARLRAHFGLDRPLLEQYVTYLGRVARGDLGESIHYERPVRDILGGALPWTLLLVGTALAVSAFLAFVAGLAAAWRRGGVADRAMTVGLTTLNAVPDFALAMVVYIVFAGVLQMFPLGGGSGDTEGMGTAAKLVDLGRHLALPAGSLAVSMIGVKYLLVRNTVISALGQDYMVLARAKGLPESVLKYRHAGRNALLPFLNIVGVQVGVGVGSAVFVEAMFVYPGVGTLILDSVRHLDYPVMEGGFLLVAFLAVTANLLIDLVSARLDPRTR